MAFAKQDILVGRYDNLLAPGETFDSPSEASSDDEDSETKRNKKYAAFLKDKERKVGPDGFVDSSRYRNTFAVNQNKKEPKPVPEKSVHVTVVDLMAKKEKNQKDYDKRLKVIEDHMWQHKQEERELKRIDGDIIKNQRIVRRTLRDYENAITRKRMAEEKKLNQSLQKYTTLQRAHMQRKQNVSKQRTEASINNEQEYKDAGRKVQLTTNDIARQFRTKTSELDLKRIEVSRLSKEFADKLQAKEEEQYRLKQELAELAIALNMEAQKGRSQDQVYERDRKKESVERIEDDRTEEKKVTTKLAKGDNDVKAAEVNKRKLSADLSLTRAHMSLKKREDGRRKIDTENRLRSNVYEQKQLNEAAFNAEKEMKIKHLDQKIQEHDTRRRYFAHSAWKQKKERGEQQEEVLNLKFRKRYVDQQRREHEDQLKHFQKMVHKGEEQEHNLYNRVRNAEYDRQKQEQKVKKLQMKIHDTKRKNAVKIKDEMTELAKQEVTLEQRLIRERAELDKVHAVREESYNALQKHRESLREDKFILGEHEREHERLIRVGIKTGAPETFVTQSFG